MARKKLKITGSTLFPIARTVIKVDPANLGTLDCPAICLCDDTCEYAIKDQKSHVLTPHAEWLCNHLASMVGIASPDCQILRMPDQTLVFGSRWEGGTLAPTPHGANPTWIAMVQSGAIPLANIRTALTRIYAFDLFIHNADRHTKNFLIRTQQNGHAVLAFDYSRAWTFSGFPPPALPFNVNDPNEKTVKTQRTLTALFGDYIDKTEAAAFLQIIKKVPKQRIVKIIEDHPPNWLPSSVRHAIIRWWGSKEMLARIEGIEKGIANGTYL